MIFRGDLLVAVGAQDEADGGAVKFMDLGKRGLTALRLAPQGARVVCVDIEPGPGVDLVADIHDMHMSHR
jgi:hypothetical protein